MRVAALGCGYVGLVSAVGLASVGHDVVGIDADAGRLERIRGGAAPFHEPGLDELLREALAKGSLRLADAPDAAAEAEVVLLAVQSPPLPTGGVDLGFLEAAATGLATALRAAPRRRRVVAIRSTVPPGTNERLVAPLFDGLEDVAVASNPEFLREGSAVEDFLHPDRVVVGAVEPWALELLGRLYAPLGAPVLSTTPPTAELAKYASNALLATLVSFSNEIARLCEATPGVDVEDVLGLVHRDRRLSPSGNGGPPAPIVSYLRAGCGYGGSCLPKDVAGLAAYADGVGEPAPLLRAVQSVNAGQPARLVDLAAAALGGLAGRRVAVLGAAFKAGTDDLRDSPALRVVEELLARGASVAIFDPLVPPARLLAILPDVDAPGTLEEAVAGADACLVTTPAPEFQALSVLDAPLVVDGRRALEPGEFADRYAAIGRGA